MSLPTKIEFYGGYGTTRYFLLLNRERIRKKLPPLTNPLCPGISDHAYTYFFSALSLYSRRKRFSAFVLVNVALSSIVGRKIVSAHRSMVLRGFYSSSNRIIVTSTAFCCSWDAWRLGTRERILKLFVKCDTSCWAHFVFWDKYVDRA